MPDTNRVALEFEQLPRYTERRFLSDDINLGDVSQVKAIHEKLLARPIASLKDLENWVKDRSELEAAFEQHATVLYIRMTCQTDDASRASAYRKFVEDVVPIVKPLNDQLNLRYLAETKRFILDPNIYTVYERRIRGEVELFHEGNVPLQTQESLLAQEYQTLCGSMTVSFEGKEHTLAQMAKYLLQPDRALRELAWRASAERRFKERDRLDNIFDEMLKLRRQIAANAGCPNYCDYQFRAFHRFDYTPDDCKKYHACAQKLIVPLLAKIYKKRQEHMKLSSLRPWDLFVDPAGRPGLKPFDRPEELIEGVGRIFERTDQELDRQFKDMTRLGLLDLASRRGKAPGGYQSTLTEARKPFIFMNAVGVDSDVRTLLHEAGHAFHALASAHQPIFAYRHAPMEFCEVASMSMELLGGKSLDVFYNKEDFERSRASHLEDIVQTLTWVATIDSFQHWIYENPQASREQRANAWLNIRQRFGGNLIDWSDLKDFHSLLWHRQLHIFEVPFYYIEYGIAQLGAIQLWLNSRKDDKRALAAYRRALSLGGSRPLTELFAAAGLKFDFSENTIAPLMAAVEKDLQGSSV